MLYSLSSQEYLNHIPHRRDYDVWRSRLADEEYQAIMHELRGRIEGDEIVTASWIPGSNWESTVYYPILKKACQENRELAARFFGLLVWQAVLELEDVWAFGRYEKDGVPIEGMTYFRLSAPPPQQ